MKNSIATCILVLIAATGVSCVSRTEPEPLAALATPSFTGGQHRKAMQRLDAEAPSDPETLKALHQIIARDYYTVPIREEALNRLAERDLANLKRTIRQTLPRTQAWGWVTRLSEIISERDWVDLSPALVSSWARVVVGSQDDLQRPEYLALAKLHGADRVTQVVYEMFLESKSVGEQGLRTRCWDLLHRLGQRERLVELLASERAPEDDAMLIDLRAGATDLGIVPRNREEILWLRKLREPSRAEFWSRAMAAASTLPAERRLELELRDLPILVSVSLHDRELLAMPREELYKRIEAHLRTQPRHVQESNYDGFATTARQTLQEHREQLTWGDLAAMHIAIRAMQVPQVVEHLFNYAERDKADTSTEYGGVISLDDRDRFEVREFQPVMRRHDQEFIASQAMLDEAYTSIFHFHLHVQNYRNDRFAGPGFGDLNYADNTRANCLVLTFMNRDTMNVDYYRHGRVVVDLGVIRRSPDGAGSAKSAGATRPEAVSGGEKVH